MENSASEEEISALTDGELTGAQLARALDRLRDPERLGQWERYHLIRDTLHGDLSAAWPPALAQQVSTQLAAEPALSVPTGRVVRFPRRDLWRQAAGAAIAASVTAVAILGVQSLNDSSSLEAGKQAGVAQVPPPGRTGGSTPPLDPELEAYLVKHSEYSASSMHGVLPYVRIVSPQR